MPLRTLIFAFASLLASAPSLAAATYHVSPTGADGAGRAGTLSEPFQTIQYALSRTAPGDTIELEGGATFAENVSIASGAGSGAPLALTVTSPSANRATVQGDGAAHTIEVNDTGGIVIENLVITGPGPVGASKTGIYLMAGDGAYSHIRVRNVDVSGCKEGISVYGWSGTAAMHGYDDVVIEDSVFHHNFTAGGSTWADNQGGITDFTIRSCTFHDNYGDPDATSHTGSGFVIGSVVGGLMEHCIAYDNGKDCDTTGGPVGLWTYDSTDVTIQFCEAYNNRAVNCDGGGFDIDGGAQDCVIQYCYSHDNDGAGYLICQYSGARAFTNNTVRYCISENDGRKNGFAGIHFWSSGSSGGIQGTEVYGNTVYNEYSHVVRFQNTSGQSGTKMWNNIFVSDGGQSLLVGSPPTGVATFQGNCWFASDGAYDIAGHATLDAWRAATGQEELGGVPVGIGADPLLSAAGAGVTIGDTTQLATLTAYTLQSGSPCAEGGLDLGAEFGVDAGGRDFYGNTIPVGPLHAIGAHDSDGSPPPAATISLDAPLGGESVLGRQDIAVTWAGANLAGTVTLEYSVDGGAWQPIASAQNESGSVVWEAPNIDTTAIVVRARGTGPGDPTDQSGACSVAAIVDADDDRIDDTWETGHFGDLATADDASDTDGDGTGDLAEFWAGTDPSSAPADGGGCAPSRRSSPGAIPLALLAIAAAFARLGRRPRMTLSRGPCRDTET